MGDASPVMKHPRRSRDTGKSGNDSGVFWNAIARIPVGGTISVTIKDPDSSPVVDNKIPYTASVLRQRQQLGAILDIAQLLAAIVAATTTTTSVIAGSQSGGSQHLGNQVGKFSTGSVDCLPIRTLPTRSSNRLATAGDTQRRDPTAPPPPAGPTCRLDPGPSFDVIVLGTWNERSAGFIFRRRRIPATNAKVACL